MAYIIHLYLYIKTIIVIIKSTNRICRLINNISSILIIKSKGQEERNVENIHEICQQQKNEKEIGNKKTSVNEQNEEALEESGQMEKTNGAV